MPRLSKQKPANKFATPALECARGNDGEYKCDYLADAGETIPGAIELRKQHAFMETKDGIKTSFSWIGISGNGIDAEVHKDYIHAGSTRGGTLKCRMELAENGKAYMECGSSW